MKNWKTTLIGALIAGATVALDLLQKGTVDTKTIIIAVGFTVLGIFAKDFNVSGTAKAILFSLVFLGAFSAPAFALDISKDSSIDGHVMLGRSWDYDRDSERVTVSTERDNLYVEAELGYRYKSVRPFIAYKELHQYRQEKTAGVDLLFYDAPYGVFGVRTSYEYVKTLRVPQRYLFTGVFFKF